MAERLGLSDTDPEVERMLVEAARELSPGERLMQVFELNRAAEAMALAGIRERYGETSPREEQLRLAALRLDRETMVEVFEWDPEVEGY